jgi:hypothetical protein
MGFFSSVKSFATKVSNVASFENFRVFWDDLVKLFGKVRGLYLHLTGVVGAGQHLWDSIVGEIDAWKNFRQDIRLNSRVVNIEIAIRKTRELIAGIPASYHAAIDLISQIKKSIQKDVIAEEAAGALAIETAGLSEVAVAIGIIYQVVSFFADVIEDFQTIVDELRRLRLEVEKLDTIFLSQDNKRKTYKLADGKRIRIRVGKLHSAGL